MAQHTIYRVPASLMPAQALLPKSLENRKRHKVFLLLPILYLAIFHLPYKAIASLKSAHVKKEYYHVTQ